MSRVILDNVMGGLYGLSLGDALGVPHEFPKMHKLPYTGKLEHRFKLRQRWRTQPYITGVGQWSDDTELTLVLAHSLIKEQKYDMKSIVEGYIKWANSGQPFMGTNTRELFKVNITKSDPTGYKHYEKNYIKKYGFSPNNEWKETSISAEASQSNGSLMRCFPLACLWNSSYVDNDIRISNPSSIVRDAEHIHITALRMALSGNKPLDIWNYISTLGQTKEVKQVFTDIKEGKERVVINEWVNGVYVKKKGWVLSSFYISLLCLVKLINNPKETYSSLMKFAIDNFKGSDTDTNGCIAGALIGSIIGYKEMTLEEITRDNIAIMLKSGITETDIPREDIYRPIDLDIIAEQLCKLSSL